MLRKAPAIIKLMQRLVRRVRRDSRAGVAREFCVGQTRATEEESIGANVFGCLGKRMLGPDGGFLDSLHCHR